MSSSKCARCEQTVYPVEGLRCLDKIWHKGCFKCQECNMTLSLKNYKGFEKKPYCNAHCPQAKATTVADTPEIRRLAENTRIQSQAKYHEDFERSKGKGFTAIADDPETLRIKNTSKIISNVAYHGELERKKQMEEKRTLSGPEEAYINNNNSGKHQNMMQHAPTLAHDGIGRLGSYPNSNQNQYHIQSQQQHQQQLIQQQQIQHQKQQQLLKQQQQMLYAHDPNKQPIVNRPQQLDPSTQQHLQAQKIMQQYPIGHPQQQQFILRQQQHQMMLMAQHAPKQSNNNGNNNHLQPQQHQQMIKHHMITAGQLPPQHQMMLPGMVNSQRAPNPGAMMNGPPQGGPHHMMHNYHPAMGHNLNGVAPKQQQQTQYIQPSQQRQAIHPSQMQPMNNHHHQMRPHSQQIQPQHQVPRRVFRAMYDYVANDVDEVSFFENDILIDCVNVDGNWLIGKVARSGQTGMLPANYVTEFSSQ